MVITAPHEISYPRGLFGYAHFALTNKIMMDLHTCAVMIVCVEKNTVKAAFKETAYKELIYIPQSLAKTISVHTFIRNSSYKEHIFMVPMRIL